MVTVACESKGSAAALPFVEAAQPTHPSLLDEQHLVPELFNTRNVPAAFWIDEGGRIVRANDPIYAERRNLQTGEATRNERYLAAVRDWVRKGQASEYVQDRGGVETAMGRVELEDEQAAAHFRLGVYLYSVGRETDAAEQMRKAHALRPDNWNYKRQAWNLGKIEEYGYANVIEAIRAPGAPQFYRQVDIVNQ